MKKLALFFAFVLVAGLSFAQNSNVRKADRALENGDLQEAKDLINEAAEHEKTINDPKTWYTRGTIYQAILNDEGYSEELVKEAAKSYDKVFSMVEEGDKYFTLSDLKVQELWGGFVNEGSEAYSAQKYEDAVKAFDKALLVIPDDTTATLYAGVASQQLQNNQDALKYYYRLLDLDYHSEDIYGSIISIERYGNEDMEKALEMTRIAKEKFPENDTFEKQEINLLINSGQVDVAKDRINDAIEKDPNNANLYFNLGYLYEQLEQPDKAEEAYLKAIEIDPDYLDANFNYAVYYYNKAADLLAKARDMDLQTYRKKGKALEKEAVGYLEKSKPYFEKALEIAPEELAVIETLQTVYAQLGENEKSEEMRKKAEKLGADGKAKMTDKK
ncbi:Tetratricopeptide repeat-containing protein [Marivirga sericea]|uniref:Tetratricopeptide repeat-containing protein n=1 Tax=Marivirga sericea TaxID=1028 RepID=A0A1X7IET6_9BACT|nr:tetratricopeptide repeat protein [Marivirga sericea]SMG12864.1 Tetratricopeptide repeat-containing protein [Marivirga sericea]